MTKPSPRASKHFSILADIWEKQPSMDRHLPDIHCLALEVSMVTEDSFSFPAYPAHTADMTKESSEKNVKSEGTFNLLS